MKNYLHGWLRLLRLPNFLTVPGDVLAGMAVVLHVYHKQVPATSQIVVACLASILLYAAGLLDNDLVDQEQDARERPDRPLPSGTVPRSHVVAMRAVFIVVALLLGCFVLTLEAIGIEVGLTATILVYNRIKQTLPTVGGVLMGLCRGLNVLFGAAVLVGGLVDSHMIWATALAACWTAYIFTVTLLSQRETTGGVRPWLAFVPTVVTLVSIAIYGVVFRPTEVQGIMATILPLLASALLAAWAGCRIHRASSPGVIPENIGLLIRNLLFFQAAACFAWNMWLALGLLLLWPVHYLLCRWFYAS